MGSVWRIQLGRSQKQRRVDVAPHRGSIEDVRHDQVCQEPAPAGLLALEVGCVHLRACRQLVVDRPEEVVEAAVVIRGAQERRRTTLRVTGDVALHRANVVRSNHARDAVSRLLVQHHDDANIARFIRNLDRMSLVTVCIAVRVQRDYRSPGTRSASSSELPRRTPPGIAPFGGTVSPRAQFFDRRTQLNSGRWIARDHGHDRHPRVEEEPQQRGQLWVDRAFVNELRNGTIPRTRGRFIHS